MYCQVQELLTLFGVPYVIAPQETEAQCAWMNHVGIVDAVITDDSDAFLFGVRRGSGFPLRTHLPLFPIITALKTTLF